MNFNDLKKHPHNPRKKLGKKGLAKLLLSIIRFPKMMELRKIIYNVDNEVLAGNQRLTCLRQASELEDKLHKVAKNHKAGHLKEHELKLLERIKKGKFKQSWFELTKLSKAKQIEFMVKDNTHSSEFEYEEFENEFFEEFDFEDWLDFDDEVQQEGMSEENESENNEEAFEGNEDLKSTFQVIIECKNEGEQEALFNKLSNEEYQCRVLTF